MTASITVPQSAQIDVALEHMRHTGVRCALAVDEHRRVVVGMITAYDILGDLPMRHMHATSVPRSEVLVWQLMRRTADWAFLSYDDVEAVTVRTIARLFDDSGMTHLPVMNRDEGGTWRLRGLFSASKVRRLLQL